MKLVTVFILVALPALCYAGSGCPALETVVKNMLDSTMTPAAYLESLGSLASDEAAGAVIQHMKACFNKYPDLMGSLQDFMNTVYASPQCADF